MHPELIQNAPANAHAFQTDSQTHSPLHVKRIIRLLYNNPVLAEPGFHNVSLANGDWTNTQAPPSTSWKGFVSKPMSSCSDKIVPFCMPSMDNAAIV